MEDSIFHLAIPCQDIDEGKDFYVKGLGCELARRYEDRITLNFFGDQVVCHLSDEIDEDPSMYPRHFGKTFYDESLFEDVLKNAREKNLEFFQEPMKRWEGEKEEHRTFFLKDPSNNLLEFKYYKNPEMSY